MRKKLIILLALFFVGLIIPNSIFANDPAGDPNPDSAEGIRNRFGVTIAQEEIDSYIQATEDCSTPSLECLVKNTITFTMIELTHNIMGDQCSLTSTPEAIESCQNSPLPERINSAPTRDKGFIGDTYNFITQMFTTPPAATSTYVADVLNSANIATPAYAQGIGFSALDPILELWKKFRNIAYMGFIFIFIAIGFMIMFRTKIGGQTAVTAQQAIPSVIVSLLFVTFSYAIAGILIDFMYVIMFMMVGLFAGDTNLTGNVINLNIFGLGRELIGGGFQTREANDNAIRAVMESITGGITDGGVFAWLGGLTVTIVIAIALLIATFKLFFELLKSYASIVMNVVISPLVLMAGAIPGKNVVKPWMQGLIGNLAAFPTVLLMLIIFKEFTKDIDPSAGEGGGFVPPFLLSIGIEGIIGHIMGLAVVLALPEIVAKVKKALGASDGFGFDIAKAAMDRSKEAWSGKMPLGMNARNITKQAALLPVRAGTAYAGSKILSGIARSKGLDEEKQRAWGRVGGLTGALAGPRILGKAPSLASFAVRNLGEAAFDVGKKHVTESAKSDAREAREGVFGGMVGAARDIYQMTRIPTPTTPATGPDTTPPETSRDKSDRSGHNPDKVDVPV